MLIRISSARGPIECERAVWLYHKELLKEFSSLTVISVNGDKEYAKSILVYSNDDLSFLEGTVQWICQSEYRPNHKRKNWYIDVSVLEENIRLDKIEDIRFESCRASGAGGQHVNRTNSAVKAIHIPTGISVIAMDQRSQHQNKKIAYLRLLEKLNEKNSVTNRNIDYSNWNNHNSIVRGNPCRVYKGKNFKLIRKES